VLESDRERIWVSKTISAPPARIFALLIDPNGHVAIDGSGMLLEAPGAVPVQRVGDTFRMEMDREPLGDLPMGRYHVINTVTRLEKDRLVEWNVGASDRSPIGHVYGYRLEPVDEHHTRVTSYCDWSGLNPKLRGRIRFPLVPPAMLSATLDRLEAAVAPEGG
jgi:hypothetical protein